MGAVGVGTIRDGSQVGDRVWRVAIVEDHVLQRRRTEEIVGREPDLRVVATCAHLPEFLAWLARTRPRERPDLLLLDLGVDRGPAADPHVVGRLVRSGLRVLVLSAMSVVPQVRAVLRAGVAGVVAKTDPEVDVLDAVRTVLTGREWMSAELAATIVADGARPELSEQEEQVLRLYASGLSLPAVAQALGVKVATAKTYLTRIKSKYADANRPARTKLDLSRIAAEDGYLDTAPRLVAAPPATGEATGTSG